jgi:hypothetical protein
MPATPAAPATWAPLSPGLRGHLDVTNLFTLWLLLLYGISANQVVPGIGALGSPALLMAMTAPLIWAMGWVHPEVGLSQERHPLRAAVGLFFLYHLFSYGVASTRPITALEANGATRSLLTMAAMSGVALLVADGVRDEARLTALLRRVTYVAALFCLHGMLQLVTRSLLHVNVPGLQWNAPPMPIADRGAFGRPPATGLHAIEYSVVAGAAFPLAIHFVLHARTPMQRYVATGCALLIGLAVPLSSTRSGLVSMVVGLLVLFAGWRGRRLVNGILSVLIAVPLLWMTVPGVVGTFIGMFTGTDDDPSIQARLRVIPRVMQMIRERPLVGLGTGTWSPEEYFLLDNQIYVSTLELGILGMLLVFGVLALAVVVAATVHAIPGVDPASGHLSLAVAASIAAFTVTLVTFDAFHYRILTGTLFLLVGAAGAFWRLNRGSEHLFAREPD